LFRPLQRIDRHFQTYLDTGRLAGYVTLVARRGQIAHLSAQGVMDVDTRTPMQTDGIFRIYSMTKPITLGCGNDAV